MLYLSHEDGQGLVEFALILVSIAIIVVSVLAMLGPFAVSMYSKIVDAFEYILT